MFWGQCSCTFCATLLGQQPQRGRCAAVRQSGSRDTISRTVITRFSPYVLLTAETQVITLEDITQNVIVNSSYKILCVYNIKYMEKSTGQNINMVNNYKKYISKTNNLINTILIFI